MAKQSSGYSGTPLAKKLGIKDGDTLFTVAAPKEYQTLLNPLPKDVKLTTKLSDSTSLVHMFVTQKAEMKKQLASLRKALSVEIPIWISWPKKASKVATDITEDTIREVALPMGFVDIKVCAVSEVWSGLKLVVRKELR